MTPREARAYVSVWTVAVAAVVGIALAITAGSAVIMCGGV